MTRLLRGRCHCVLLCVALFVLLAARKQAPHQHVKHRHEEDAEHGRGDHTAREADADGILARRTCAGGSTPRTKAA